MCRRQLKTRAMGTSSQLGGIYLFDPSWDVVHVSVVGLAMHLGPHVQD